MKFDILNVIVGLLSLLLALYGLNTDKVNLVNFSIAVVILIAFFMGRWLIEKKDRLVHKKKEFISEYGTTNINFPAPFASPPHVTIIKEFGEEYTWKIESVSETSFVISTFNKVSTSRFGRSGYIWKAEGKKS